MLKTLFAELDAAPVGAAPATAKAPAPAPAPTAEATAPVAKTPAVPPGRSRDNPATVTFLSRTRLNKPGSAKETWHVELDLGDIGLDYTVGDSFGVFPANDPALADQVIAALQAPPDFPIGGRTLREVLIDSV